LAEALLEFQGPETGQDRRCSKRSQHLLPILNFQPTCFLDRYAAAPGKARSAWNEFTKDYFLNRKQLVTVLLLIDASIPPQAIDLECAEWLGENQVRAATAKALLMSHFLFGVVKQALGSTEWLGQWEVGMGGSCNRSSFFVVHRSLILDFGSLLLMRSMVGRPLSGVIPLAFKVHGCWAWGVAFDATKC
jgi:hypothetical protein